ncbi:metalloprotease PmbA [Coralloluteibacterium stylophorae]|uniref:Metalloprotease PmbA n=1 Tax=Coralloluteibacterium stylophorae TaxID=1776034 RepID=A0A8J7VWJ0_9GAMM|nr:metalloprotease PmbA [Coralloluteibacterium stylophorae]MBS7456247.1 metalloprotease PmbA [Coralloluteibacterium stylophorae]
MNEVVSTAHESVEARSARLSQIAEDVLARCRAHGAGQAEVSIDESRGLAVNARVGEVETVEHTRDRGVSVTVYLGRRKGSASTADLAPASIEATVAQACAIAGFTEEDPAAGLADAELMARPGADGFADFDQWHPWALDADSAVALALECEAAGREADPRIANSDGASVNSGESVSVYANSHGFLGVERGTSHSLSCSLIAGSGDAMQRDYWYSAGLAREDLESARAVGRRAAERTVARLAPRQAKTGQYPVLYTAETARSLVGHLLSAISGGALYRRASFLVDRAGTQVFPEWFGLVEEPHRRRGFRSAAFDGDGVATRTAPIVENGVLARYVLGSYSARKLGLATTANAGGVRNLTVTPNAENLDGMLRGMGSGLLVTEMMGHGINPITGDYSRGAAGFWIESGEIAYPVDEITIAGNLKDMFLGIEAVGTDIDPRSHVHTGPILVGRMTVAGAE